MVAIKTVKVRGRIYFLCGHGLWSAHFFPTLPNSFFSFRKLNAATHTQSTVAGEEFLRVSHASPNAN